jgi:signal transduction histidine kinase
MQKQLGYVMFISLILAIFFAALLSRRITKPITDITSSAHKMAEGQFGVRFSMESSYSELQELAVTLEKMSSEMERSSMMQKDLMANVSHDLRTPLTMIKSYAEMIRDLSGDNPEKRNAHLEVIIDESDRLNQLVNDMLALSRMQSGAMEMNIQPFNIYDAVETILAPYRVLEEKEGYTVNFNCRHDLYVEGDEERIKQVISNLLSNAVKYCGTDKTVFINIRRWDKIVHFEVVDHGVGIKPEELSLIWERHYKTSSNHVRPTRGSGLGLSIVKEILEMHGARFGAESKVGRGTTVWFELKAAQMPISEQRAR